MTIDLVSLCTAVGTTCLAILAGFVGARWQNRVNKQIAMDAGIYKKYRAHLAFQGIELSPETDSFIWCLLHPGKPEDPALYQFAFDVINTGDGPLKDAVLTIDACEQCIPDNVSGISVSPGVYEGMLKRSVNTNGKMKQIAVMYPTIAPKAAVRAVEQFRFQPTIDVPMSVDVTTKDKVDLTLQLQVTASIFFVVTLMTPEHGCVMSRTLEFQCSPDHDFDMAAARYQEAVIKRHTQWLKTMSSRDRALQVLFGPRDRVYATVMFGKCEVDTVKRKGKLNIHFMKNENMTIQRRPMGVRSVRFLRLPFGSRAKDAVKSSDSQAGSTSEQ